MARVALLVAVLAALCYTSQAIPVHVKGTQALPYGFLENAQEALDLIHEKAKEVYGKAKDGVDKLSKELQEKGQKAKDEFNKRLEELQKLYQENKVKAKEFCEQLVEIAQKAKEEFKEASENTRQRLEKLFNDFTNGKEIQREVEEILKKLPEGQSGDEAYGYFQDKMKELEGLVEKVKKIIKENGEDLEKYIKEILDKYGNFDKIKEIIEQLKKEVLERLNEPRVQQASLTTSYGLDNMFERIERLIHKILKEAGNITKGAMDIPRDIFGKLRL